MAKKFFYVCAGLFLLALSYQMGVTTAKAQSGGSTVVAALSGLTHGGGSTVVYTASGEIYVSTTGFLEGPYALGGNVFSGPPIPTIESSWGALKVKSR